jgi:hypothetical protein
MYPALGHCRVSVSDFVGVVYCTSSGVTTRAVQGVLLLEGLSLSYASRMNTMVYVVGTAKRNTLCPQERVVLLCV